MVAVYINNPQSHLFEAMQRMFLSAPGQGEMGGRFSKFRKSFGKFLVNFDKIRHQPNFEKDFLAKSCTYFLNVFAADTLVFQKH